MVQYAETGPSVRLITLKIKMSFACQIYICSPSFRSQVRRNILTRYLLPFQASAVWYVPLSNVTRIPFFFFFLPSSRLLPHGTVNVSGTMHIGCLARHFKAGEICGCVVRLPVRASGKKVFVFPHLTGVLYCAARGDAPMSMQKIPAVFFYLFFSPA